MKQLVILGSTGSIGRQALEVVDHLNQTSTTKFNILGLSCAKNWELFCQQVEKYQPQYGVIVEATSFQKAQKALKGSKTILLEGSQALEKLSALPANDLILNAIVGSSGLASTYSALKANKRLALANKESLVIGGSLIKSLLKQGHGEIIPVDSEHSAIFQLCKHRGKKEIKKLILTASGGPFRNLAANKLKDVSPAEALNHPTWSMGGKISIDSATLMNKALEIIEAHFLFGISYDNIDVVIHPQSIIHSLVELSDNSLIAHLGAADMRVPIQYALTYPAYQTSLAAELNLAKLQSLHFESPRYQDFPALELGYQAGRIGGSMPCVLNSCNEEAVQAFLAKKIAFTDITSLTKKIMSEHQVQPLQSLEDIHQIEQQSRKRFCEEVG